MKNPYIYDGRNCFKLIEVQEANLNYKSIGRPDINASRIKVEA